MSLLIVYRVWSFGWSGVYMHKSLNTSPALGEEITFQRRVVKIDERESDPQAASRSRALLDIFFSHRTSISDGKEHRYSSHLQPDSAAATWARHRGGPGPGSFAGSVFYSEEEFLWRNCIITLICVAIFADRAPEAFFFMKQWAEIVLQDKSAESEQIQDIYANFMTEVSEKVYAWQNDLATMRLSAKPAYKTFTYQLAYGKARAKSSLLRWMPLYRRYAHACESDSAVSRLCRNYSRKGRQLWQMSKPINLGFVQVYHCERASGSFGRTISVADGFSIEVFRAEKHLGTIL